MTWLSKRDFLAIPCVLVGATVAMAEDQYPSRPIRIVAPMAAGGGTDLVARLFAEKISARLGQPVIVENRAGAGGQFGAEVAATSPPDGYTLLFSSSSAVALPYLRKTRFELLRDFVPVGQVGIGNFVLVTGPKLPFKTLEAFLADAKANPDKYTFGSPGHGSVGHLALNLLKAKAGVQMVHVPFKSSGEIAQALISGQIDCAIDVVIVQKPFIDQQAVRALATTGAARDPALPELPTFNEAGVVPGGYEITFWYGMFLPRATPDAVIERIQREFSAVMKDPQLIERIKELTLVPSTLTASEFRASIAAETATWRKVIEDNHLASTE